MIEVFVLIYLSSGKCYTYIMCRVWLWVSVFLQACGVLWFLNILCVWYVLVFYASVLMFKEFIEHKDPKCNTYFRY